VLLHKLLLTITALLLLIAFALLWWGPMELPSKAVAIRGPKHITMREVLPQQERMLLVGIIAIPSTPAPPATTATAPVWALVLVVLVMLLAVLPFTLILLLVMMMLPLLVLAPERMLLPCGMLAACFRAVPRLTTFLPFLGPVLAPAEAPSPPATAAKSAPRATPEGPVTVLMMPAILVTLPRRASLAEAVPWCIALLGRSALMLVLLLMAIPATAPAAPSPAAPTGSACRCCIMHWWCWFLVLLCMCAQLLLDWDVTVLFCNHPAAAALDGHPAIGIAGCCCCRCFGSSSSASSSFGCKPLLSFPHHLLGKLFCVQLEVLKLLVRL
jgi:hypothetical protein